MLNLQKKNTIVIYLIIIPNYISVKQVIFSSSKHYDKLHLRNNLFFCSC